MIATTREPKDIEPNEYVIARLKAPSVGYVGIPWAEREQKYHDP